MSLYLLAACRMLARQLSEKQHPQQAQGTSNHSSRARCERCVVVVWGTVWLGERINLMGRKDFLKNDRRLVVRDNDSCRRTAYEAEAFGKATLVYWSNLAHLTVFGRFPPILWFEQLNILFSRQFPRQCFRTC